MDIQEDVAGNNARKRVNQDAAENKDIEILKVKRYKKRTVIIV